MRASYSAIVALLFTGILSGGGPTTTFVKKPTAAREGVAVGHTTLIAGEGALKVGVGPVRTGVTAILPRGIKSSDPAFAGWFSLNGNGEMTGTTWIEESGFLKGPVLLTNTSSVSTVRDAVVKWWIARGKTQQPWVLPVVAETYDGYLNDINGFHVKEKHVFDALNQAKSGPVLEGNGGGGGIDKTIMPNRALVLIDIQNDYFPAGNGH